MDVREAVRKAKECVVNHLDGEDFDCLRLEEVDFDHESDRWKITVSFPPPSDSPKALPATALEDLLRRSYKVVRIDDADGRVISLKDRILTGASGNQ